jgi:hypothetical protein
MARNNYRIFSIGYKEIFGMNGLSLEEIKRALSRFDLNSMLELSAKLGIVLFHTAGNDKQSSIGQLNLIRSLYTDEAERIDFAKKLNNALRRQQATDGWGLYSKNSILLFLKLSLENSPLTGGTMMSPEISSELSKILLGLTDYIDKNDFEPPKLIMPESYLSVKLREYMFRRLSFNGDEKYPNPLYRHLQIIKHLKAQEKDFKFAQYFKQATSVSLKTYFEAGAMLSAKWGVKNESFNLDDTWYIRREYFSTTRISEKDVNRIYDLLVLKPDDYGTKYVTSLKVLGGKDIYTYNYLILMQTPLVPILENILTCPSPEYLVARVTEGAYRIVSDYLNESGQKREYNNLPTYWGKAYERYAHIRLKNTFGKLYKEVPEEESKRADGIFEGEQAVLLFESKSIHISYKASVTGSADDLENPLKQCFGKKHGIVQIVKHAEDIHSGNFRLKTKLGNRKILPILILSEYLPSEPLHYKFFEELLNTNKVKFTQSFLLPFIYLTIEEVEYLEALATVMSADDIEKLLIEYSHKIHNLDIENDFSFKNFLFAKNIHIPLNQAIMTGYKKYTDKILKYHFPEEFENNQKTTTASK